MIVEIHLILKRKVTAATADGCDVIVIRQVNLTKRHKRLLIVDVTVFDVVVVWIKQNRARVAGVDEKAVALLEKLD